MVVPGPSSERKEMNVVKILKTYTILFIKYKYEQKPNTINKWVGLQLSGLLSIPLPNFTEGDGDGELMKRWS